MVTVIDYQKRQAENGEEFFALILQGGIEMVKSKETKRYYATAKKCSIPSTFSEQVCQRMIGNQMPGKVVKVDCEAYEYTIPDTGEVIELTHRWEYQPESEDTTTKKEVSAEEMIKDISANGVSA